MIEITGRVIVGRSGAPVAGVVVEAFDLSRGEGPKAGGAALASTDASWVTKQPSVGSDVTEQDGSFRISAERDSTAGPLRLALAVLAPDGPSNRRGGDVLHLVRRVRLAESGVQRYLVTLPADALRQIPSGVSRRTLPPATATAAASLAAERAQTTSGVRTGIAEVRGREADRLRTSRARLEDEVREAMFERAVRPLRDLNGGLPDTVVRPGESARSRGRAVLDAWLQGFVPAITARGLVDLSTADAARLLDANGVPLANVADADVEQLLFGPSHVDGLPSRFRRDIVAVGCRDRALPIDQPAAGSAAATGSNSGGGQPEERPATIAQVKRSLAHLLAATEDIALPFGLTASRPNAEQIGADLQQLLLREGPAEAVAHFDFERLFLASDLPIHHHPDKGLIHEITDAVRTVADLGGDLSDHRKRGLDLLDALDAEVSLLASSDPLSPPGTTSPMLAFATVPNALDTLADVAGRGTRELVDAVTPEEQAPTPNEGAPTPQKRWFWPDFPDVVQPPTLPDRYADLTEFLARIRRLRHTDYGFTPFGADADGGATTYGLLLTYTQQWRPRGHQAGELVKTIPLAPSSSVKYHVRRKTGRSYADKRAEASESTYSSESQDVQRDIEKIVRNAKVGTSFSLTNETGGGVPGVSSSSTTSVFTANAERSSESTKEAFREEVRKHAEQLKRNSSMEVTLTTTEEIEVEETSTIENKNEELTLTCLLYELQRRFEVSERLTRVTPVVLVAQNLPDTSEIDEAWLIRYDWVLRRVLLDRSFLPAIEHATSGKLMADLGKAKELEANLDRQTAAVARLQNQLDVLRSPFLLPDPRNLFQLLKIRMYDQGEDKNWREDEEKVREVFGDDVADRMAERRRSIEQVESELTREASQLERATEAYTAAFVQYALEAVQVERLLLHLKDNIVYYVQALLDHEGRDQQFMRLRDQQVPEVVGNLTYQLLASDRLPRAPEFRPPLPVEVRAALTLGGDQPLGDVADLANPLGYVGNALVFPVRRWNPLVTFMLVPFSNAATGVTDPDDRGNITLAELSQLIRCLHQRLPAPEFAALRPAIEATWQARVNDPRADSIEVTIPTGSLFMEALPGTHPLLEDFKLLHRALDVQLVASDVVSKRLEQLRLAARLVKDVLEDPETEKVIIRDGSPTVVDTG